MFEIVGEYVVTVVDKEGKTFLNISPSNDDSLLFYRFSYSVSSGQSISADDIRERIDPFYQLADHEKCDLINALWELYLKVKEVPQPIGMCLLPLGETLTNEQMETGRMLASTKQIRVPDQEGFEIPHGFALKVKGACEVASKGLADPAVIDELFSEGMYWIDNSVLVGVVVDDSENGKELRAYIRENHTYVIIVERVPLDPTLPFEHYKIAQDQSHLPSKEGMDQYFDEKYGDQDWPDDDEEEDLMPEPDWDEGYYN